MSNNIANNPWILDTVADNIVAPTVKIYPKKLKWHGESIADGNELGVEDGQEVSVFRHFATADDTGIAWDFPSDWSQMGFSLGAMTNGELYVWF